MNKELTPLLIESGLLHTGERQAYGEVICARCGWECEWADCYSGCEDGYYDGYEMDPLWYDFGEMVPCSECRGKGGSYWCENPECATHEILRILKYK
jgi:hypothetical protein